MGDVDQHEGDETAYLFKSPANRERLLKAIDNVAKNRNLVAVQQEEDAWKEQLRRDANSICEEVQRQGGIKAEIMDDAIKRYHGHTGESR